MMGEEGWVLSHFFHGIPGEIFVECSSDCSNDVFMDEIHSSILLNTVFNQKQGHCEFSRLSDIPYL